MSRASAVLVGLLAGALVALVASAGGEVVTCVLNMPGDAGYITTSTVCTLGDGGVTSCGVGTCSWPVGANVAVQCDADIYLDQDGTAPTVADIFVDFTNNKDPYVVNLVPKQQSIAVGLVTAAASKTCKFAPTMRRKPW